MKETITNGRAFLIGVHRKGLGRARGAHTPQIEACDKIRHVVIVAPHIISRWGVSLHVSARCLRQALGKRSETAYLASTT